MLRGLLRLTYSRWDIVATCLCKLWARLFYLTSVTRTKLSVKAAPEANTLPETDPINEPKAKPLEPEFQAFPAAEKCKPAARSRLLWDAFNGEFISMGRDGLVCEGPPGMVVKVPRRHEDDSAASGYRDTASVKYFEHERAMAALVNTQPPHPNIIQSFLSTSDGVFFPRMQESLKDFLERGIRASDDDASRWVEQIVSAVAWLESMDLFHGDLRPPNILLDADHHVKICDFGNMERRGQTIQGAMVPYYKNETAGPASEQYAIGSLMYAIFSGSELLDDIDDYDDKWRMVQEGKLPSPDHLQAGRVIQRCWDAEYKTLAELHKVLLAELGLGQDYKSLAVCLSPQECEEKAAECKAWGEARRAWKAKCREKRMVRDS